MGRRRSSSKGVAPSLPLRSAIAIHCLAACALMALVWLAYSGTKEHDYVYDDIGNFVKNQNHHDLAFKNLKWMATTLYTGPYQPLSWFSLGIDYQLSKGMKRWKQSSTIPAPWAYRRTNVLLHGVCGVLLYFLTLHLVTRRWRPEPGSVQATPLLAAFAGACLYTLHPLRVESVAWATERRDVLSGCLLVATVLAWCWYIRSERKAAYAITLGLFLLSLLAKAWGMTLPAILILMDFYPFRRNWRARLIEKLPFLVTAGAFALIALRGQKKWAMDMVTDHGLLERLVQALYGLSFYLGKTLWPAELSPNYQLPVRFSPFSIQFLVPAVLTVAVIALLVGYRKRYPAALTAWLAFALTVSPVLGLFQSGYQIAADRYTYIALMPLSILISSAIVHELKQRQQQLAACAVLLCLSIALFLATRAQCTIWKNHDTLWQHVLKLDPTNFSALNGLGKELHDAARLDEAEPYFTAALEANPNFATPWENRAGIFIAREDWSNALSDVNHVLTLKPQSIKSRHYRGYIYQRTGRYEEALADFDQVIAKQPRHHEARCNRGLVYLHMERLDEAIADFSISLATSPNPAIALTSRGRAYMVQQKLDLAERDLLDGLKLDLTPAQRADTLWNLGRLYAQRQDWNQALVSLQKTQLLLPANPRLEKDLQIVRRKQTEQRPVAD